MASAGEEEVEYESDPEEVKRSLGMRRREAASDDEEGDVGDENRRMDRRDVVHSDESDGQGGAAEYDYEEDELDMEEEDEEEYFEGEDVYDDEEEIDDGKEVVRMNGDRGVEGLRDELLNGTVVDGERNAEDMLMSHEENRAEDEEKKENEPFAVPTAGAFYMHDDRFSDYVHGRQRHTHGGRKLWESKDDRKWGHDKYVEMQKTHYNQGKRSSRGRYRAHSRNEGADHGYSRGGRSRSLSINDNQNQASKDVQGRGPRRYQPSWKKANQTPPTHVKQSGKPPEKTSQPNSTRELPPPTKVESASVPARKHVASSLNSASPPFFPSGSQNKDTNLAQKKDMQAVTVSGNHENFPSAQVNALQGKNLVDSVSVDKLYIDSSYSPATGKPLANLQTLPSGSSLLSSSQAPQSTVQGRGLAIPTQMAYHPASPPKPVSRIPPPSQVHSVHRSTQGRVQSSVQPSPQQVGQRSGIGSQACSPPKTATSVNSYDTGEVESSSETNKAKGALVGKGKGGIQGSGRGAILYGGAQVMGAAGNMSVSHGDPNFPSFLPVMQFGGQHPRGIGVPAVGMAFPGYVGQPQLGLGNSEMTWLPVLTGPAGALGAPYCSPYIAVDGAYNPRPSELASSMGSSSKENNSNKSNNERKPSQTSELPSELVQRQNNSNKPTRRYSEMSFSK